MAQLADKPFSVRV